MPLKTFSALSSTTSFFLPLGILNSPQNLSKLKGSLQLERFKLFSLHPPVQKPSSPHPIVVDPRDGAAASFGVIVVALDFLVPPTAGENVGAGELLDIAVLVSEDEPTILMGMTWSARQRYGLRHNPAHQRSRSRLVQAVQVVQIVLLKLDTAER